MNIRLLYGKKGIRIDLPDTLNVKVIEPLYVNGLSDPISSLHDAMRNPIGAEPLRSIVKPSHRVGIVFNDITRPTPNQLILPCILEELTYVPEDKIIFFNATGTHRQNTVSELREMLGKEIVDKFSIVQNDALDDDSHMLLGKTKSGNEVWIHKEFMKCDVRILTGFIEPHFFAGFSGGGKAVMPGLSTLKTIMKNHSAENMDSPLAKWGITAGNPLWEEVCEAANMAQPTFLINVSLNRNKMITGVFAGDFMKAHAVGCEFVKNRAMIAVDRPFNIVISTNSGYPLDLNLYQSVKGMSAASQVVEKGGSIIMAADCWDGIPEHGEYGKLLFETDSLESLLETIRSPGFQRHDMWQAHIHALICQKAEVFFYSHNLSDDQIEKSFLTPCHHIEETLDILSRRYGKNASICVLPEGPQTIPYIC